METLKMVLAMTFFGAFMLMCGAVTIWRTTRFFRMAWQGLRSRGGDESTAYFRAFGQAIASNTKAAVGVVTVLPVVVFFAVFRLYGFVILAQWFSWL